MKAQRVAIIGASGKLGQYLIEHCLARGYAVNAVCRPQSVAKLERFAGQIECFPGATNDREVIREAVKNCAAVLTVLVPWGVQAYSSGTAQAVLDLAEPQARLIFSCGWHISRDGKDRYSLAFRALLKVFGGIGKALRWVDLDDQVEACRRVFNSQRAWTVVRCSDMEEGESQGMPLWSEHVGDAVLASNLKRRTDFALFMVAAITDASLIQQAPAIVGRASASAQQHLAARAISRV